MPIGTAFTDNSHTLTLTVQKRDGTPLPGSELTALTLTIRDRATGAIVNTRDAVALSPVADYWDANGLFTLELGPSDNVILDAAAPREEHRVIIRWTYASGASKGVWVGDYTIERPDVT